MTISPLDLGPKHAYKLGAAPFKKWVKTYSKDYVLGQLIFWYKPNESDPGASLEKASKGCLILPDSTSCYANSPQRISYSSLDRLKMFRRMVSTALYTIQRADKVFDYLNKPRSKRVRVSIKFLKLLDMEGNKF